MKRMISVVVLILFVISLSACSMKMESQPMIDSMLEALAEKDAPAALALLHPSLRKEENVEASLQQLIYYLSGRSVIQQKKESFNIDQGTGTGGKFRRETGVIILTLNDESTAKLEFTYLSNSEGEGFTGFHISFQQAGV